MLELLQLDKAASLVGKSEVTLRRLIKSGKIPFEKQKTLTGFIYMVNPVQVKAYYQSKGGGNYDNEGNPTEDFEIAVQQPASSSKIRVAVADESGSTSEYWQKKAESYEDRYYNELTSHSKTKEELGVWRGRSEHAQAMLIKLLPSPAEVRVEQSSSEKPKNKGDNNAAVPIIIGIMGGIILLVILYLFIVK